MQRHMFNFRYNPFFILCALVLTILNGALKREENIDSFESIPVAQNSKSKSFPVVAGFSNGDYKILRCTCTCFTFKIR